VAEYGPGTIPANVDPTQQTAACTLPTAAEFLSASPLPLSLTENVYNLRGQVQEARRYDVGSGAAASYTSTFTYYDQQDRTIEVWSPNAPVMRYAYDARGRQVESRTVAVTGPTPATI
jgi:YD repeat-containing protein